MSTTAILRRVLSGLASSMLPLHSAFSGKIGRAIVAALAVLGLGFLASLSIRNRSEILDWVNSSDQGLLALSILILVISNFGAALVFSASMHQSQCLKSRRWVLEGVMLASQIGKYIPGKVWGVVIQKFALGKNASVPAVLAVNLDLALLSLSVSVLATLVFAVALGGQAVPVAAALLLSLTVPLVVARYNLAGRLIAFSGGASDEFRRVRSSEGHLSAKLSIGALLFAGGYIAGWLGIASSTPEAEAQDALLLALVLCASYVIGLLSMMPAGIGARELAIVLVSRWVGYDESLAASLAVVSRAAMVLLDFLCALLGAAILLVQRKGPQC